jgi:hypothetical protein
MQKGLLVHRCTVRLNTPGSVDALGEPTSYTASDVTGVKCRFYTASGNTANPNVGEVVTSSGRLITTYEITEQCVILGTFGFSGTWVVRKVNKKWDGSGRVDHYEADLQEETASLSAGGTTGQNLFNVRVEGGTSSSSYMSGYTMDGGEA